MRTPPKKRKEKGHLHPGSRPEIQTSKLYLCPLLGIQRRSIQGRVRFFLGGHGSSPPPRLVRRRLRSRRGSRRELRAVRRRREARAPEPGDGAGVVADGDAAHGAEQARRRALIVGPR